MSHGQKLSSEPPPVLLLDGGTIPLSVARSLGRDGIDVFALDVEENHARYSRFSKRVPFRQSADVPIQKAWMDWLTTEGRMRHGGSVIFPCSDNTVEMVARHRAELESDFILPEGNDKVLLAMLDKAETYALASEIGMPTPQTWTVNSREDVMAIIDSVSFPCALKPRHSHDFRKHFFGKLFVVNDRQSLLDEFERIHEVGERHHFRSDLILTEFVPGHDEDRFQSYYTYLDDDGEPLTHFTKRKLRQFPIISGNGTYHRTDWNPKVAELGLRFFQAIGYRGLGNIEFKLDPRDGELKLMECNPRLTNSTELLQYCGYDINRFIYNRLTGQPLPDIEDYRRNVHMIRPLHDCLAFVEANRRGELTFREWIRSIWHKQHLEMFRWSDPLPVAMMGIYYAKRLLKKLAPMFSRRSTNLATDQQPSLESVE